MAQAKSKGEDSCEEVSDDDWDDEDLADDTEMPELEQI